MPNVSGVGSCSCSIVSTAVTSAANHFAWPAYRPKTFWLTSKTSMEGEVEDTDDEAALWVGAGAGAGATDDDDEEEDDEDEDEEEEDPAEAGLFCFPARRRVETLLLLMISSASSSSFSSSLKLQCLSEPFRLLDDSSYALAAASSVSKLPK